MNTNEPETNDYWNNSTLLKNTSRYKVLYLIVIQNIIKHQN